MTFFSVALAVLDNYKVYAPVVLTVVSGLGEILTKNYSGGIASIFQALTVVFGGATVATLHAQTAAKK